MNLSVISQSFRHLLRQPSKINTVQVLGRNYAFKSDLKIKWVRPPKVSCIKPEKSGDLAPFPQVDTAQYPLEFRGCKELETADDTIKRLFSLEYAPEYKTRAFVQQAVIDTVKRHDQDTGSMEVKIAKMTVNIRSMQRQMDMFPRNKRQKVRLKELIDKRKKFLKYLRRWDYKRFEWLLEKLQLVYKAPPDEFHWITRKESLQKLTDKYCNDLKNERLAAYRKELESQQEGFLKEKIEKLEFIRKEQEECGVPITVQQSDIDAVKLQLEKLLKERAAIVTEE